MAKVVHKLVDDAGSPIPGVTVDIILVVPGDENAYVGDQQIISHKSLTTNSNGTWSADLIPNSTITPTGTTYKVTHTFEGEQPNMTEEFSVPDSPGPHNLTDILV